MQTKEILRIKGNALFTVAPDAALSEAIATMVEHDIGSLVVMDRGRLEGMLTFREVLQAVHEGGEQTKAQPVSRVMVKNPIFVGPDMEMDELRRRMLDTHSRYVPVMEESVLVGVLSFHDVAKAVLEEQSFENRMLKGYIKNWPDE
jgi:CBS domain-containing protein